MGGGQRQGADLVSLGGTKRGTLSWARTVGIYPGFVQARRPLPDAPFRRPHPAAGARWSCSARGHHLGERYEAQVTPPAGSRCWLQAHCWSCSARRPAANESASPRPRLSAFNTRQQPLFSDVAAGRRRLQASESGPTPTHNIAGSIAAAATPGGSCYVSLACATTNSRANGGRSWPAAEGPGTAAAAAAKLWAAGGRRTAARPAAAAARAERRQPRRAAGGRAGRHGSRCAGRFSPTCRPRGTAAG